MTAIMRSTAYDSFDPAAGALKARATCASFMESKRIRLSDPTK